MTDKSSISLTGQQADIARSLVREGRYSSLSSVVQQGLDLFRDKTLDKKMEREALRILIQKRQGGAFVSGSDMDRTIKKMAARKRHDQGV